MEKSGHLREGYILVKTKRSLVVFGALDFKECFHIHSLFHKWLKISLKKKTKIGLDHFSNKKLKIGIN